MHFNILTPSNNMILHLMWLQLDCKIMLVQ